MESNIHEIYNLLFEGKTIKLPFHTKDEAEHFRVTLFRYKKKQDSMLRAINAIEDTQIMSFLVQLVLPLEDGQPAYEATVRLRDRDIGKKYVIQIVSEEPEQ